MSPALPFPVPLAQPGPITDEMLEHAIRVADQAIANDMLTEDGAAILMFLAGPVLRECLDRRRRMAVIEDMASPGTVILFPGSGA